MSSGLAARFPGTLGEVVSARRRRRAASPCDTHHGSGRGRGERGDRDPRLGSARVFPAVRGASLKPVVAGVVSTSFDCERFEQVPVMRTLTPLTAGSVAENVSNAAAG